MLAAYRCILLNQYTILLPVLRVENLKIFNPSQIFYIPPYQAPAPSLKFENAALTRAPRISREPSAIEQVDNRCFGGILLSEKVKKEEGVQPKLDI